MTNSNAFYSCNVCKWRYRFASISAQRAQWIRAGVPLCMLALLFLWVLLLGFIPIFGAVGEEGSSFGVHVLNGVSALGFGYMIAIVGGFTYQYWKMGMSAAQLAAGAVGLAVLPLHMRVRLYSIMALRTSFVALFFGYNAVFFFPYSGLLGVVGMFLACPPLVKKLGDWLVQRMELDQPILELTPEMVAAAAASTAAAAAAAATAGAMVAGAAAAAGSSETTSNDVSTVAAAAAAGAAVAEASEAAAPHVQQGVSQLPGGADAGGTPASVPDASRGSSSSHVPVDGSSDGSSRPQVAAAAAPHTALTVLP